MADFPGSRLRNDPIFPALWQATPSQLRALELSLSTVCSEVKVGAAHDMVFIHVYTIYQSYP